MEKSEFMAEIDLLAMAYPQAFPVDARDRTAIAAIWYDHFSHIPKDIFAKAAKWCREHERFLSIASLWESIVAVADVPTEYDVREQIATKINNASYNIEGTEMHPIALRVYMVLDLENNPIEDYPFEREYKRTREWWVEKIMQPEFVGLLTGETLPQLEEGKKDG